MISHNNVRAKKSCSLVMHKDSKENKENCSINIQQQSFAQMHGKVNKIRASLGPLVPIAPQVQELEKNFSSLQIMSAEDMHLHLKKKYSLITKKDYS